MARDIVVASRHRQMSHHTLLASSPLPRRLVRLFAATAVALLAFSVPARADVIVVENEEQWETMKKFWKAGQEAFLQASQAMTSCYQNDNAQCATNMRVAIVTLPTAVFIKDKNRLEYLEVRNNSFRYQRAFSLLLLNAIVRGHPGGTCADYSREAALPLTDKTTRTLAQHLTNAEQEVGNRQHLPEYQMLLRVQSALRPCVGRA